MRPEDETKINARRNGVLRAILEQQTSTLPPLQPRTARWVKHQINAPFHANGIKAMEYAFVTALWRAQNEDRVDFFQLHHGQTVVWGTGLKVKGGGGLAVIVFDIDGDGKLGNGRHTHRFTQEPRYQPRSQLPIPQDHVFISTRHGNNQGFERGKKAVGKGTAALNVRNAVALHQTNQTAVEYTYYYDKKDGSVHPQWLVQDPNGSVVAIRTGEDQTLFQGTSLKGHMAASQQWLANLQVGGLRFNADGPFHQEAIA